MWEGGNGGHGSIIGNCGPGSQCGMGGRGGDGGDPTPVPVPVPDSPQQEGGAPMMPVPMMHFMGSSLKPIMWEGGNGGHGSIIGNCGPGSQCGMGGRGGDGGDPTPAPVPVPDSPQQEGGAPMMPVPMMHFMGSSLKPIMWEGGNGGHGSIIGNCG